MKTSVSMDFKEKEQALSLRKLDGGYSLYIRSIQGHQSSVEMKIEEIKELRDMLNQLIENENNG